MTDRYSTINDVKESKHITIMFVDIVRSSDILRLTDSETAEAIFNQVIAAQIAITCKYRGTVNQVMGDGMMCLFGAEPPFDDHALRAVSAGQDMLRSVNRLQKQFKNVDIKIRIGINTGEVILAKPDNDGYRAAFQVTSENVHITDRVLKQAHPNQMLVSQNSKHFLERYFHFKEAPVLKWTPDAAPIALYQPTTLKTKKYKDSDSSIPRTELQHRILSVLSAAHKKSEPAILWLTGMSGIGKTSVVDWLVHSHFENKFDIIIPVNFYPDAISDKNLSLEHAIMHILFEENAEAALAAIKNSDRPTELVANFLLTAAEERHILLVLEDMHWAKESTLLYLEKIISMHQGHQQLVIIATSRQQHPFAKTKGGSKIKSLTIDPMTPQESTRLLNSFETNQKLPRVLKNKIYSLSDGNPYFMKEFFLWAENKILQGTPPAEIKQGLDKYTPGKIADVLYNKLAMSGRDGILIAKCASVLGMRIHLDLLHSICGFQRDALLTIMTALEEAHIIKKDRLFPAPEWVFTHELLQKVVYHSILKSTRCIWHSNVIQQLKKERFKGLQDRHAIMAVHADKSKNNLLTFIYSKWAARQAQKDGHHNSCLAFSRHARQALKKIPALKCRDKHYIAARTLEINSLFITGKYAQAEKIIHYLLDKKDVLKKSGHLEQILSFQELLLWIKGDLSGAVKTSKTILSLNMIYDREDIYIRENSRLANLYLDMGRYTEAVIHDLKVIRAIPDIAFDKKFHLLTQAKPSSLATLTLAYILMGDKKKSRHFFNKAHYFLEKSEDDFTKIFILVHLAHSLLLQNKNHDALLLLKQAVELYKKTEALLLKPYTFAAYGIALTRTGNIEEGARYARKAEAITQKNKIVINFHFKINHATVSSKQPKAKKNYIQYSDQDLLRSS